MNSQGTICQICGKVINLQNPGAGDFCNGHNSAPQTSDLKSQLDSIATPGASRQPQQSLSQSEELRKQLDAIPSPSSDEQTIPPASQESGSLKTQVHARPGDMPPAGGLKSQLDTIPTPGSVNTNTAAPPRPPQPMAPQAPGLKNQLDSIPTPGGLAKPAGAPPPPPPPSPQNAAPPPPPPRTQSGGLKSELDSIPTPGKAKAPGQTAQSSNPQPLQAQSSEDLKSMLDSIPTPGAANPQKQPQPQATPIAPPKPLAVTGNNLPAAQAQAQAQAQAAPAPQAAPVDDWKSQLDSIPTPKGLDPMAQPSTPAPSPNLIQSPVAKPPALPPTDLFTGNGEGIYQTTSDYAKTREFASVDASSGYTMIFVVLIVIVLGVFGFMMMNPNKKPDFSSIPDAASTSTTTAPSPTTSSPAP